MELTKMVPREPTATMFITGTKAIAESVGVGSIARHVWYAMYDAAPAVADAPTKRTADNVCCQLPDACWYPKCDCPAIRAAPEPLTEDAELCKELRRVKTYTAPDGTVWLPAAATAWCQCMTAKWHYEKQWRAAERELAALRLAAEKDKRDAARRLLLLRRLERWANDRIGDSWRVHDAVNPVLFDDVIREFDRSGGVVEIDAAIDAASTPAGGDG